MPLVCLPLPTGPLLPSTLPQVSSLGPAAMPGTPGYLEEVRRHLTETYEEVGCHADPRIRPGALLCDGFFAVTTAAKYRIWSRSDCRAFERDMDTGEGLLAEFADCFGRRVVAMVRGELRLVQVSCRSCIPTSNVACAV